MKTSISFVLALGGLGLFSSCTTVVRPEPTVQTTNTTTEKTTLNRPLSTTVESTTTQSY
jgi:hypothetical protein